MGTTVQQGIDPLDLDRIPAGTSPVPMAAYRLSRLLRTALGELLSRDGELGLVAWRICLALSHNNEISQKALVEFTDMEQGQVSRAMRLMEERGLIESMRSREDGRVRLFRLNDKGWDHFNRVLPAVTKFYRSVDRVLTPEEQAKYLDMSQRVARAALSALADLDQRDVVGEPRHPEARDARSIASLRKRRTIG
jgi:DNA-binding MarR family transcriptional regulator